MPQVDNVYKLIQMIQLIQKATKSESNEERRAAQNTIVEIRQKTPQNFFVQIAQVFANRQVAQTIRQASGTLIAVSVLAKNNSGHFIWDSIGGNIQNNVKNMILEILIDPSRNVRRAAANIVSAICFIELPRNGWDGLVQKICENVNHQTEIIKQASILTLGFICSRMKQKADFSFSHKLQDSILSGIIVGIQQSQPFIIDTSLKALKDSLASLNETLQNKQYRDFILKQLIGIISNQKYSVHGLQILGQFVKTCYVFLGEYIQGLAQLLEGIIANHKNQDACIAAMEIWQNIAYQYKQLSQTNNNIVNFITDNIGQKIVALLLKNLAVMQDSENQQDENPISDSASKALQTIFQNGSKQYKQLVLQFVKLQISQQEWMHRQASIKAFSLLLYGLSDQQNQQLISGSINQLMGLLGDSSRQVQFATLDSLTIISQVCGKFILVSPHFIQYLKLILSKLAISERFLKTGCQIIDNLCQAEKQSHLGKFSDISNDLIQFFLNFALGNQATLPVISWSTTTIMNILQVTNNETVIKKYIYFIVQNFDKINQISDHEKRQVIGSAFFTILQFCLHGIKSQNLQTQIIQAIYTKVTGTFKQKKNVNADGFYAVEALVPFLNRNKLVADDFWAYIVHALTKWTEPGLFRATVSCIASFINSYGEILVQKLDTFFPQIIQLLKNPSFSKQLKLDCLVNLGQVYLLCGNSATKYLQSFLQVILLCCSAALQMAQTDFQYAEQLKDSVIETLMCIVHGLNSDSGVNEKISFILPNLFQFVRLSTLKKYRPTVNYVKKSLLLLADFGKFYPKIVKQFKSQPYILQNISTLKTFNKNKQLDQAIRYIEQQLK